MRFEGYFNAYLDDFNLVRIYMRKDFYGGYSRKFFLSTSNYFEEIKMIQRFDMNTHFVYEFYIDGIDFSKEYEIMTYHGRRVALKIGLITKTARFDELYYYDGPIGSVYHQEYTEFFVYSPTSPLCFLLMDDVYHKMDKTYYGFHLKLDGDYDGRLYNYVLKQDNVFQITTDPYAKSSNANHTKSAVIDLDKLKIDDFNTSIEKYQDAVIYEASVRDFTVHKNSGIINKNLYLGMVEDTEETRKLNTSINYLKYLGITHLQLLPILDFASVDELNKCCTYNWGYDAFSFFSLEGSYSKEPNNPYSRLLEYQEMVNKLHENGISLNLDVVSNHVFDVTTHPLNIMVPNYYFVIDDYMTYQNTSGTGNDFDSRGKMAKRLLLDQALYLVNVLKVDGIRYDLMGIFGVDIMQEIEEKVHQINPKFMIYGEGWDLGGKISPRATIYNQGMLKNIAFFNDVYRDTVKGSSMNMCDRGFLTGKKELYFKAVNSFLSNTTEFDYRTIFSDVAKSVNYVECHDNATLYDKLTYLYKNDIEIKHITKNVITFLCLSTGICFIHSGLENMRTKDRNENSYDLSDIINQYDYDLRNKHQDLVDFTRDLIRIRKENSIFRTDDKKLISKFSFDVLDDAFYRVDLVDVVIMYNMSKNDYSFNFNHGVTLLFDGKYQNKKCDKLDVKSEMIVVYRKN